MHYLPPSSLTWLLEKTNSQALAHLLKQWPAILSVWERGGFKLTPQSFENPTARQRLISLLLQKECPTESFLLDIGDLKSWQPLKQAWRAVDQEWMENHWRPFLQSLPDPRPWCIALIWWSNSDKLCRLSSLLRRCPSLWQEPLEKNRRPPGKLEAMLQYFGASSEPCRVAQPDKQWVPLPQLQAMQGKYSAAKQQLEQLRRDHKQLQQQLSEEQARNRDALKEQQRLATAREEELQAEIAAVCTQSEEKTRVALDNFQQMILGIHPDLQTFANTVTRDNADLPERLTAVLQKQSAINRKHGLKCELRAEIERLEKYLLQVRQAIDEAIAICPELPALQKEIENRLALIYEKLQEEPEQQALAVIPTRLKTLIKSIALDSEAQTKFSAVREFLEDQVTGQLLLSDELAAIQNLLAERCRLQLEVATRNDAVRIRSHSYTQMILSLPAFVHDLHRVILYVDAYNVIIGDSHWKAIGNKRGLLQARQEFLGCCQHRAGFFKQINLVYDGHNSLGNLENHDNITVHFAPKLHSDQSADDYIVKLLRENPKPENTLRWVVTDDEGLQKRCQKFCDGIVASSSLNQFLRM